MRGGTVIALKHECSRASGRACVRVDRGRQDPGCWLITHPVLYEPTWVVESLDPVSPADIATPVGTLQATPPFARRDDRLARPPASRKTARAVSQASRDGLWSRRYGKTGTEHVPAEYPVGPAGKSAVAALVKFMF